MTNSSKTSQSAKAKCGAGRFPMKKEIVVTISGSQPMIAEIKKLPHVALFMLLLEALRQHFAG